MLDEADILCDDESFEAVMDRIRSSMSETSTSGPISNRQVIHVTATLPTEVHNRLLDQYPSAASLMGPSLHRVAAGLEEVRFMGA